MDSIFVATVSLAATIAGAIISGAVLFRTYMRLRPEPFKLETFKEKIAAYNRIAAHLPKIIFYATFVQVGTDPEQVKIKGVELQIETHALHFTTAEAALVVSTEVQRIVPLFLKAADRDKIHTVDDLFRLNSVAIQLFDAMREELGLDKLTGDFKKMLGAVDE